MRDEAAVDKEFREADLQRATEEVCPACAAVSPPIAHALQCMHDAAYAPRRPLVRSLELLLLPCILARLLVNVSVWAAVGCDQGSPRQERGPPRAPPTHPAFCCACSEARPDLRELILTRGARVRRRPGSGAALSCCRRRGAAPRRRRRLWCSGCGSPSAKSRPVSRPPPPLRVPAPAREGVPNGARRSGSPRSVWRGRVVSQSSAGCGVMDGHGCRDRWMDE